MDSIPDSGITFSLDLRSAGVASLRQTVMIKLSEFMGTCIDDVLAEYVVVLVGHGKQQRQAIRDLEAFLGDQSKAFVTWLWDHLRSNIHLYTTVPKASSIKEVLGSTKPLAQERSKEPVKNIYLDAQPGVKDCAQVSPVTHEGGRSVMLKKDSVKVDLKSRKYSDMGTSCSGREKTRVCSEVLESDRSVANKLRTGHGTTQSAKRSRSPNSWTHRKRNVPNERHHQKRNISPTRMKATRRLLQSAVREAVALATGYSSSLKHLRSVVSAGAENSESVGDASGQLPFTAFSQTDTFRQGKRAVPALMLAMKEATAAADDATKVRGRLISSVWDRLGKKSAEGIENTEVVFHGLVREGPEGRETVEDRFVTISQHEGEGNAQKRAKLGCNDRLSKGSIENDAAAVSDPMAHKYREGQSTCERSVYAVRSGKYQADERNVEGFVRTVNYSEGQQTRPNDGMDQSQEESGTVWSRLAKKMVENGKEAHKQKGVNASSVLADSSPKIVNISVNVNTWKSQRSENLKDTVATSKQTSMASGLKQSQEQVGKAADNGRLQELDANKHDEENDSDQNVTAVKKRMWQVQQEMTRLRARQSEVTKENHEATLPTLPGAKQAQRSQDDEDKRTLFATNIHFAASKEAIMAHFNRCGDIERIVMLTDGPTGQSKGSAYIEFSTIDAADKALALNGSSFYSRLLKVVRKDAAIQDIQKATTSVVHPTVIPHPIPLSPQVPLRSRFLRGSPHLLRTFSSMPRPYGNSPNLQWKRDSSMAGVLTNSTSKGNQPLYGLPKRAARSLSYVRSPNIPAAPTLGPTEEDKFNPRQVGNDDIKLDLGSNTQERKIDVEVDLEQDGGD